MPFLCTVDMVTLIDKFIAMVVCNAAHFCRQGSFFVLYSNFVLGIELKHTSKWQCYDSCNYYYQSNGNCINSVLPFVLYLQCLHSGYGSLVVVASLCHSVVVPHHHESYTETNLELPLNLNSFTKSNRSLVSDNYSFYTTRSVDLFR